MASGTTNLQSIWSLLNTFQLVIVIALLDIDYPPKVVAFFQGFMLATLSMPPQLNFVEGIVQDKLLSHGETNERYTMYGFTSTYFVV